MELLKQTSTLSLQQKNFTAVPSSRHSMFATAASEYWESQKIIRKRKKKQQNNVKTFIVASNWINTHVYVNCLIGENFWTFIQIKYQEKQSYKHICSFRNFNMGKILPEMKAAVQRPMTY